MKKASLVICLALTGYILKAQFNPSKDPFMTKSLAGQTIKNIEVQTSGGSIEVIGATAGNNRVDVFVRPNNSNDNATFSKEEIQKRLDEYYDLSVKVENNKITAIAKQKKNNMDWKKSVS